MQNCRAGASPANSFVSANDALVLQSNREHRGRVKSADHRHQVSKSHHYLLANRSGITQKELTMKRYSLLLGFIIALVCGNLSAEDKIGLQPNATVLSILQGSAGKTVELHLNSGEKIGGKIQQVTDNVVHLSHLTGAEYFDGFINTKDISAIVIRTAGR
ncbi:MAG: hypothetical protein DME60_06800 [Verrucomicrobia bacterium]|nr:MAG: hypothetical protein DME60_06800 [Verrucomicrobiota bacterium]